MLKKQNDFGIGVIGKTLWKTHLVIMRGTCQLMPNLTHVQFL